MHRQSGFDLHCHSSYSDGSMTPQELVEHAHTIGLKGISITDHDAVGSFQAGYPVAQRLGIDLISGIEISTEFQGENIHVLGYAYDPDSQSIAMACDQHRGRREERNRSIVQLLNKKGVELSYDEVVSASPEAKAYGRPHIAKVLMQKGYVDSIKDAFKKFIGSSCPCYVTGQKWTTIEAIDIIHAAGGFAFLAHPHLISKNRRVKDLLNLPFDGIEGFYSRFSLEVNDRFIRLAKDRKLMVSGGSDFHGTVKPEIRLGAAISPQETVDRLLERLHTYII